MRLVAEQLPRNWSRLSFPAKRQILQARGYSYEEVCRYLGSHGALKRRLQSQWRTRV